MIWEFNYKFGSNLGDGRRGGCAPPHPPAFAGGSAPRTPKRRSAPLAAAVVRFLATDPLVRGRTFSPENRFFLKKPLVWGSFAAWGRTVLRKSCFLSTSHLSWAASLPGTELFLQKTDFFFNKPLVRGNFASWGRTFLQKLDLFVNKPLVPGSFAAWGRTFSQKSDFFSNKPLFLGSFAAWAELFSQKSDFF